MEVKSIPLAATEARVEVRRPAEANCGDHLLAGAMETWPKFVFFFSLIFRFGLLRIYANHRVFPSSCHLRSQREWYIHVRDLCNSE